MGDSANMIDRDGQTVAVPVEKQATALDQGYRYESSGEGRARARETAVQENYSGVGGKIAAGTLGIARTATLGLSDVALDALGAGEDVADLRRVNPGTSLAAEIAGSFLTPGVPKLGAALSRAPEGASLLRQVGQAGFGRTVEGSIYGLGSGISELALSKDPVTAERAASVLSSNMLFGGAIGGGLGAASKLAEKGLARAGLAINEASAARTGVAPDLAELDSKGLRAAHEQEVANIEAQRAPKRQELVDDFTSYRKAQRDQKLFLATNQEDVKGIGEIKQMSKTALDADRQIDRMLNNPIKLAERPEPILGALQQQENALTRIAKSEDELRAVFAGDKTGTRMAALDAMPTALEQNRALQGRVRELIAKPQSERLSAIANAKDALSAPALPKSMAEQALSGTAFGAITSAAHAIPVLGQIPGVAHLLGAKGAGIVTDLVFGRMGKGISEGVARSSAAAEAFARAAPKASQATGIVATSVLKQLRYAPAKPNEKEPSTLRDVYKARSDEIKSQTMFDATGKPVMRPEAREKMARQLRPVAAVSPVMADKIETLAAKRIEYLASIIPRKPDIAGLQIGPDNWRPSDMAMRAFARAAHAVEDPGGVEERAANGSITPEDAEAYWAVYPERAAHFQQSVLANLGTVSKVAYSRKVALSIFARTPVDASMHPNIVEVLQGQFADEPGSKGGTQHPTASPQFGSISKSLDKPTPGQSRASR